MTTIGRTLAAARERAGYSIDDLSSRTCIRATVLAAMERDEFGPCGGDFYARGHIRAVCREFGIDHARLVDDYDREYATHEEAALLPAEPVSGGEQDTASRAAAPRAAEVFGRWAEAVRAAKGMGEETSARLVRPRRAPEDPVSDRVEKEDVPENVRPVPPPPLPEEGDDERIERLAAARTRIVAAFTSLAHRYWSAVVTVALAAAAVISAVHAWPGADGDDGFLRTATSDVAQTRADKAERAAESRRQGEVPMTGQISERELPDEVEIRVHARSSSWVRVIDGDRKHRFTGVMRAGETKEWTHPEKLYLHMGNAGGVELEVNGEKHGAVGVDGEVTRLTIDREYAAQAGDGSDG
ncbi:cytoskeletal protein RodZ [Nocardiopsis mwathae]|uniref:Cytoskeletal protein RodZ n=1 Tax=Nocardiopsis mwathae TaxID=1472723 RepID=A0A7W9YFX5_9ACTN|nr:helix-turn-helix domain-containing protein [Nocardiopsis mwathae]MBB6170776.1 cytoskeletal protein RodZ [Nocardiopsis mwathae]